MRIKKRPLNQAEEGQGFPLEGIKPWGVGGTPVRALRYLL